MESLYRSILVTGGAGFIGSNFLNKFVKLYPDVLFTNVDALTDAGDLNKIEVPGRNNYDFYQADIVNTDQIENIIESRNIDAIVHFAAESHVDNSLENPSKFVTTNVMGTFSLLEVAKKFNLRFHHISTDEVYGSLGLNEKPSTESHPTETNSPYSATKAGSDCLVRAYRNSFNVQATISRCSNNYGPYQNLTSLIPKIITNALGNHPIPIYGNGSNQRDWIFVEDHIDAVWKILNTIFSFEPYNMVFNIGGNCEKSNLGLTKHILNLMGKDHNLIKFVQDRAGHDFRYAIDYSKIKLFLGWEPQTPFEKGIAKTIQHYSQSQTK